MTKQAQNSTAVAGRWWDAFQRGEDWAFEFLYRRFQKPLLGFLSDRVGDLETAQDLVQEVFIKVHRFRGRLEANDGPLDALSGWIFQVARNTLYDWWRSARVEAARVRHLEPLEELAAPDSGAAAESSERRAMFRNWLSGLTAPQRRVAWLWLVRGLSLEEISSQLGLSLNAVKLLLHRARLSALSSQDVPVPG